MSEWQAGFGVGFACGPFVLMAWLWLLRTFFDKKDAELCDSEGHQTWIKTESARGTKWRK